MPRLDLSSNHGTFAAYNKWHESELERWLSDHDVPYPTPADRADLEALVDKNWNDFIVEPYNKWDTAQLSNFIYAKGKEATMEAGETKDSLVAQVKANWYETDDNARQAWASVKDWIFDTWTESQLKAFCDKNDIPGTFSWAFVAQTHPTFPRTPACAIFCCIRGFSFIPANFSLCILQSLSHVTATPSSRKLALVMRPPRRSWGRLLLIRATGFTRPGPSLISSLGSIPTDSLSLSPRPETSLSPQCAAVPDLPTSKPRETLRA